MSRNYMPGDEVELYEAPAGCDSTATVVSEPINGKIEVRLRNGDVIEVSLSMVSDRLYR